MKSSGRCLNGGNREILFPFLSLEGFVSGLRTGIVTSSILPAQDVEWQRQEKSHSTKIMMMITGERTKMRTMSLIERVGKLGGRGRGF